jgi:hypothetical protein
MKERELFERKQIVLNGRKVWARVPKKLDPEEERELERELEKMMRRMIRRKFAS